MQTSDAAVNLRKRQNAEPAWALSSGADAVEEFYKILAPDLPQWAKRLHDSGRLVVGEIGKHLPDAYAENFDDGSYAIVITSGYLRLLQVVAADVSAAITKMPDGSGIAPLLSSTEAVFRIASLLTQYRQGLLSHGHGLDTYPLSLGPFQCSLAGPLAAAGGLFVFAHELGHIGAKVNNVTVRLGSELDADVVAFTLLLATAQRRKLAMSYWGGLFAIRLYVCLERSGYKFTDVNALPSKRLELIKGNIRTDLAERFISPENIIWAEAVLDELLQPVEVVFEFLQPNKPAAAVATKPAAIQPSPAKSHMSSAAAKAASTELKRLQDLNPPWELTKEGAPFDQTKGLALQLKRFAPQRITEMLNNGKLVIGEVGLNEPSSSLRQLDDGSYLIIVYSGLLALLEAVSRFLHTRIAVRLASGVTEGETVTAATTIYVIATLLQDLAKSGFDRTNLGFALPGFWNPLMSPPLPTGLMVPLEHSQMDFAHDLAEGAAMFIIASYFPGITLDQDIAKSEYFGQGLAAWLFSFSTPSLGFRKSFAAALFADRVLSCIK